MGNVQFEMDNYLTLYLLGLKIVHVLSRKSTLT